MPPSPRKTQRYTPASIVAGPLGLPFGLTSGRGLGEAMGWGKAATVAAECGIAVVFALAFAVALNAFFGKKVEVADKRTPEPPQNAAR